MVVYHCHMNNYIDEQRHCKGTTHFTAFSLYILLTSHVLLLLSSHYHYPHAHCYCNPHSLCQPLLTFFLTHCSFTHHSFTCPHPCAVLLLPAHCYTGAHYCTTPHLTLQPSSIPPFLICTPLHSLMFASPLPTPCHVTTCTLTPSHLGSLVV